MYVINNLKLYKVLFSSTISEPLPIILEILKTEFEDCNFNYIHFNKDFEIESIILPFITHVFNRNSIYLIMFYVWIITVISLILTKITKKKKYNYLKDNIVYKKKNIIF